MMAQRHLAVRDAVERWLARLQTERTEETLAAYHYRLKLFVEWCEDRDGIEHVSDLTGWELDAYETHRRQQTSNPNTLKNELTTLKNWLEYCEKIELVDDLAEKVEPPTVPKREQSSNVKLSTDAANALLSYYRTDPGVRGCRGHALLEVVWHTGARVGEVRALDLEDIETTPDERHYLVFRNRPESGTRLKKGPQGERPVMISQTVADVVQTYIGEYRHETTDDVGRKPLFTSNQGRPAKGSFRQWLYRATIPCHHSPCPHGNQKETCEYTEHNKSGGCPSSRSPHQIRTGAITWMRDRGLSEEVVAERVNASVETIRTHYDKTDPIDEMLNRRAADTSGLDIATEDDENE
jgi:site-specific recombinase XerD